MQIPNTGNYSVFSVSTTTMLYSYIFSLLPHIFTINGEAGSLKLPTKAQTFCLKCELFVSTKC